MRNDWVNAAVLTAGALIGAFTLAFSAFVLYFGETIYSFASFSMIIGIFSPIFFNFAVASFFCLVLVYAIRFGLATMIAGDKILDKAILYINRNKNHRWNFLWYIIFFSVLTLKSLGVQRDETSTRFILDDSSVARIFFTYTFSASVTLAFFIGFLNFANVIIYIMIASFVLTFLYLIRNFLQSGSLDFYNIHGGIFKFHYSNIHLYIAVVVFLFGFFRADYLSRLQPEVLILTAQGSISARIIGYTTDGLVAYEQGRIIYIPDTNLLQISFSKSPSGIRDLFILGK